MTKISYTEYVRLLLLIHNAGLFILRAIFLKFVKLSNCENVDTFLKPFKSGLKRLPEVKNKFKVLFPDVGNNDIEKWDITILTTVLIHCCTIETKVDMSKLNSLLYKHVCKTHSEIESFLKDERNVNKINTIQDRITTYQYKILFPSNFAPSSNIIDDWGVDLILRVVAVTCEKEQDYEDLRKFLVDVILANLNYAISVNDIPDLEKFLDNYKSILTEKKDRNISDNLFQQIFPSIGKPDLYTWDTDVLMFVVLGMWHSLSQFAINGIKKVRNIRNDISHPSSTSMEPAVFQLRWDDIYKTYEKLVKAEIPSEIETFKTLAKQCGQANINLDKEDVNTVLEELVDRQIEAAKEVEKDIQPLTDTDEYNRTEASDQKVVHLEIRVLASNEQMETIAEKRIKELFQKSDETVSFKIDSIEIFDIRSGCVILVVRYSSLKQLHEIIQVVWSAELQIILNDLAAKIKLELDEKVIVTAYIAWHELQNIRREVELHLQESSKPIEFRTTTTSKLISISIKTLTNHETKEGFRLLSEKLSTEFDTDVKIIPMLDSRIWENTVLKGDVSPPIKIEPDTKVIRRRPESRIAKLTTMGGILHKENKDEELMDKRATELESNPRLQLRKCHDVLDEVVLTGYADEESGFQNTSVMSAWQNARKSTIFKLRELAEVLEKVKLRGRIAKLTGAKACFLGATIGVSGFFFIPFTGGLSAVAAIVGGVIGGVGTVKFVGSFFGQWAHGEAIMKEIQVLIEKDRKEMEHLFETGGCKVDRYISNLQKIYGPVQIVVATGTKLVTTTVKGADFSLDALNKMSKVVNVAGESSIFLSVIFVTFNIQDFVTNSIDVLKKTPYEVAHKIRKFANTLAKELNDYNAN